MTSQMHCMLIPLLSQQDASGRCTFSMTILWRGWGGKGDWICSSRKHFTDYAELLWLTGAVYRRQFDVHEFRFTSIKVNSSIQIFTVMTCDVLNCRESPIFLSWLKDSLPFVPSCLVSLILAKEPFWVSFILFFCVVLCFSSCGLKLLTLNSPWHLALRGPDSLWILRLLLKDNQA